jgi:hypothetical protein
MTRFTKLAFVLVAASIAIPAVARADVTDIEKVVVLGAVKDPANALYPKDTSSNAAPALPVVYEDSQADKPAAKTDTAPGKTPS